MIEVRLGKPLYAVFAASTRIAAVANCRITNSAPWPHTAAASCERTVLCSLGYGCRRCASTEIPKNTPIHTRVAAAFFDSGRRNDGTPLEIASTPVSATAPEENPLASRKIV